MFLPLLLCAICPLTSSSVSNQESDNTGSLKVTISKNPPVSAILGSSLILPCMVSWAEMHSTFSRHAILTLPVVKWIMLSSGLETEILVARGQRVKVSSVYRGRASLPYYTSSPANLTLSLEGLRYNDSGVYRCTVKQGLEDSYDQIPVKVKGVVFHHRHASGRYAFSFWEAHIACEDLGGQIATPGQFLAGYHSSLEQCAAGWLSDQTVRYPIQSHKKVCIGDEKKERTMRNHTVRNPLEHHDVYCYMGDIEGKVLYSCTRQHLSLKEAKDYCQARGAELATLGQVYAAWIDGFHHCSPGWLADGSVRYPVADSRGHCRGSTPGVKTVYRYSNQTGFPEPQTRHDVYCFQGDRSSQTDASSECMETDPGNRSQGTVAMMDPLEEIVLGQEQVAMKNEADEFVHSEGQVDEQGTTKRNFHTVHSLMESQNLTTPTPQSKDAKFHVKQSNDPKNHEPMPETNRQSEDLTPLSEIVLGNSEHYQPMPDTDQESGGVDPFSETSSSGSKYYWPVTETKLESRQPINLSKISAANSKHHKNILQTKVEYGYIKPSDQMAIGNSKHYQDMPETNLDSGDLALLSKMSASYSKHYQHIPQTNLEFLDIKPCKNMTSGSSKHYQDMPETNLDSGDLELLSKMSASYSKHYEHIPQTNLEFLDIKPCNNMTSGSSKHYQDMPETNLDSGDLELLSDTSDSYSKHYQHFPQTNMEFSDIKPPSDMNGGSSKHYQDMPETNLDSGDVVTSFNIPGDISNQYKILSKGNQADILFEHSADNSGYNDVTPEAYGESSAKTPNSTQPKITHEMQETSLLSGSPRPFYDNPKEDMNYEAIVGPSETAASSEDMNANSGLYMAEIFDTASPTVDAPLEGNMEHIASFSPSESAVTWDEVKALHRKENVLASVESRNLVTLSPLKIDCSLTSDHVQTSKPGPDSIQAPYGFPAPSSSFNTLDEIQPSPPEGSMAYSTGTNFIQEQPGIVWPTSSSSVDTVGQDPSVETSLEKPIASGHFEENSFLNLNPITSSLQSVSTDIFAGVESTRKQPDIVWSDPSAPTKYVVTSGQAEIEFPTESSDPGGISAIGSVPVKVIESFLYISLASGSTELPGAHKDDVRHDDFPITLMTTPIPFALAGPTFTYRAIKMEVGEPSNHMPEVSMPFGSGHCEPEQKLRNTADVEASSIPHPDEGTASPQRIILRSESVIATKECPETSVELSQLKESKSFSEEPGAIYSSSTEGAYMIKSHKIPYTGATVFPTTEHAVESLSTTSTGNHPTFLHQKEEYPATTLTSILDITFPPHSQAFSSEIHPTRPVLQELHADLQYNRKHSIVTQEQIPGYSVKSEFFSPIPGYHSAVSSIPLTGWWSVTQNFHPSGGLLESSSPEEDYNLHTPITPLALVKTNRPAIFAALPTKEVGIISDGCFKNPCANGGTCVEEGPFAKCLCLPTYGGDFCQIDLDPCEAGWQKFQGFCYKHFTDQLTWGLAEQHCRLCGGHLASVQSPEEQDFINNKSKDYQWIGLNDKTIEGDFHWSDGSPLLYENWYSGQPDSYFLSGEDCVVMVWHDDGRWSDMPCNYHLSYTCKKGTSSCGEPPAIPNTRMFSKGRLHYEINSMVRYYCVDGFLPRQNPVIKCLPNGQWEDPQITCVPVNSADDNQASESPFESEMVVENTATEKVTPQFWDINWDF